MVEYKHFQIQVTRSETGDLVTFITYPDKKLTDSFTLLGPGARPLMALAAAKDYVDEEVRKLVEVELGVRNPPPFLHAVNGGDTNTEKVYRPGEGL